MKKAERTRRKGEEDEKERREEKKAVKGKIRKGMPEICLCVNVYIKKSEKKIKGVRGVNIGISRTGENKYFLKRISNYI